MPPQDPEKRKNYQKDLMRERRRGEKRRATIKVGQLPALAADERDYHHKNFLAAARMQAIAMAVLEKVEELTPAQALEYLAHADKLRSTSAVALAALDAPKEQQTDGTEFGKRLKEMLQSDDMMEHLLAIAVYGNPETDAPAVSGEAKPKRKARSPSRPSKPAAPTKNVSKKADGGAKGATSKKRP